jgi:5-formyltetrahydrofolate cyclo-ligase
MNIQDSKSDLRQQIRARRQNISPAIRAGFSPFANGSSIV